MLADELGGSQKGGFQKGVVSADAPLYLKRNEGTFGCSPVPKRGMRVHSNVLSEGTFAKTTLPRNSLVFPLDEH